ncbi:MAG: response regulator [Alphaproteobacteria bacterium]|nr:response regulator [Alphaproteobacteria bacterium]
MSDAINKPVEILLVEDNEGDVFLTKKAFRKAKFANNIHVAADGEVALEMLFKKERYVDLATPDIILLDINLPKKDGKQVLKEIKENESLRRTPVVILTSSKADKDIFESYDLQASGYIVKPVNLENFCEVALAIEDFWFKTVILPNECKG